MACWSPAVVHLPPLKHFMWFPVLPSTSQLPSFRKDIVGECTRIDGNSQLMELNEQLFVTHILLMLYLPLWPTWNIDMSLLRTHRNDVLLLFFLCSWAFSTLNHKVIFVIMATESFDKKRLERLFCISSLHPAATFSDALRTYNGIAKNCFFFSPSSIKDEIA